MEEFFDIKGKLFTQTVQKPKRKQEESDHRQCGVDPKIPQWTQNLAASSKEKDCATQKTDQQIDPQLAACGAQGEQKQERQHQKAVKNIQS